MKKANGRLNAPTKEEAKELESIKGKKFRCNVCGEHVFKTSVEFAEVVNCSQCGSEMTEEV